MKKYKVLFYTAMTMSLLVGLWHFFVPSLYGWYTYIPEEYKVLSVTIDYVNSCFSLLLSGLSILLIWWGKRIFTGNREAITLFGFMTLVWLFRIVVTLVNPCPSEANPWLAYGQLMASVVIALLLVIPFIYICIKKKAGALK